MLKHVADKAKGIIQSEVVAMSKVVNRLKTLKIMYVTAKKASSQSGFNMTADGKIEADDISWDVYVRVMLVTYMYMLLLCFKFLKFNNPLIISMLKLISRPSCCG